VSQLADLAGTPPFFADAPLVSSTHGPHNTNWRFGVGNGFHPHSLSRLCAAGFRNFESFAYDVEKVLRG
jgi:hypothetical protein